MGNFITREQELSKAIKESKKHTLTTYAAAAVALAIGAAAAIVFVQRQAEPTPVVLSGPIGFNPEPKVTLDPQLAAIAGSADPDLQTKLTEAEIKAALRAAAQPPPSSDQVMPSAGGPTGTSEYAELERVRRAQLAQQQEAQDSRSVVKVGVVYHDSSCDKAWRLEHDQRRDIWYRVPAGPSITVATARASNLMAHSCI